MTSIPRRRCLQSLAGAIAAPVLAPFATADAKPSSREEKALAWLAGTFLKQSGAPALSIAFARQGQLVYSEGYGLADPVKGEKVTPAHRFRIASVSKPLTSAAIYALIEQGKLKLTDKVFTGILAMDPGKAASPASTDITLHHLLTHTGGGWSNKERDPMFQHPEMNHEDLINTTLQTHALDTEPGKAYAYSNFGYCVLGRVIEKVTGKPYAGFVQQSVLTPCGIKNMQIAGDTLADRAEKEVVYLGQDGEDPYGMNIRRMDSHGGWMATPTDLVQFLTHVDGFRTTPDILRDTTIKTMTTGTTANPAYASGFSVNTAPNWWHGGSLPGTSTLIVRTASGMCWAAFANSRSKSNPQDLDAMMWQMAKAVPAWKA